MIELCITFSCIVLSSLHNQWTAETAILYNRMQSIWYSKQIAKEIINTCDKKKDCIITASFIAFAESNAGRGERINIFWLKDKQYNTRKEVMNKWIKSYKIFWYTHKQPTDYYQYSWYGITHYCKTDTNRQKSIWCPNGLKNAKYAYNILSF